MLRQNNFLIVVILSRTAKQSLTSRMDLWLSQVFFFGGHMPVRTCDHLKEDSVYCNVPRGRFKSSRPRPLPDPLFPLSLSGLLISLQPEPPVDPERKNCKNSI